MLYIIVAIIGVWLVNRLLTVEERKIEKHNRLAFANYMVEIEREGL